METSADTFSTANNPCKLLIFNQDSNLGRMLKEYLEHDNYESNICHNIDQAYKLCRITDYTACIIDLQTTNNDGFKLAIGLKTLNSEISIIFIGKYSTKEEIVEAYHSGADDFVRKPFSLDELKARLYAILRRTQDLKVKKFATINSVSSFLIHKSRFYLLEKSRQSLLQKNSKCSCFSVKTRTD